MVKKPGHPGTFMIVQRNPNRWLAMCDNGHFSEIRDTYEQAEDAWREHVWKETGVVPDISGNKDHRWQPPAEEKEKHDGTRGGR